MNIFSAIFGAKKAAIPSSPQSEWGHNAAMIDEIGESNSVDMLRECTRYHSGYVREAALRRCVELALPELFSAVVERLNDWVPKVRQVARTAIVTLLPRVPPERILAELPVILRLHSGGRGDHASWLDQFETILIQAIAPDDIIAAAQGNNVHVARACAHLIWKHRLLESTALIALILRRRDDIVLACQAVQMCSQLPRSAQVAQYYQAARSHFGPVRVLAIRALLDISDVDRMQVATSALQDVQGAVRAIAIQFLTGSGFDVRSYYRNMLLQGPMAAKCTRICLNELAGLRVQDDLALITSFLTSDSISIRVTAYAAWLKLAEHDKDTIARMAFLDIAPGVRKFALKVVRAHGAYIALSVIQPCLMQRDDVTMTMLFVESQRWTWLECIAQVVLTRGTMESIQLGLDQSLRKWLCEAGSWFQNPSREQFAYLASPDVIAVLRELLCGDAHAGKLLAQELERYRPA
jgi:hypothetical protein